MRSLTQRLVAEERCAQGRSEPEGRSAFRVCEKLRRPLCIFAGVAGFRSLLARAIVLAKAEAPFLGGVQIKADGTFQYEPETEARMDSKEAAQAGAALVDELLGLLITFIGEALTLRLVQDAWPNAAAKDSKPGGKQL